MNQTEGIVTPSGKVDSNGAIARMLDLKKRVKMKWQDQKRSALPEISSSGVKKFAPL